MVAMSSEEGLPPGWREHVRVRNGRRTKVYTHANSSLTLYSKKRVWSLEQGTLHPSGEQDQKSTTSKKEGNEGTLKSLSEQSQKSVASRSEGTLESEEAFQGTLESSSEQEQMVGVETSASLDWLPPGWIMLSKVRQSGPSAGMPYKVYFDPSGCRYNSKLKVMEHLEAIKTKSLLDKQNAKEGVGADKSYKQEASKSIPVEDKTAACVKDDDSQVISRTTGIDGLPPGWMMERRFRKVNPKKKDPYYIDPNSDYEFRSKKDVIRYLETGDMSKCAIKPQRRRRVEKAEHSIPTPTENACESLDLNGTDGQGDVSNSASATLLDWKKKKLQSEELSPTSRTRSQHRFHEALDEKSLKRKLPSVPARSSKRLSGVEPEELPVSSAEAIRAAVLKAIQGDSLRAAVLKAIQGDSPVPCKFASPSIEEPQLVTSTDQPKNLSEDPLVSCEVEAQETPEQMSREVQNVVETPKQASEEVAQEKPEQAAEQVLNAQEGLGQASERVLEGPAMEDSWYLFADSLADPSYEFAFKTLTGEIPFEDTLTFQSIFEQPAAVPSTHTAVSMGLPAIGTPALFHNDVSFQLDSDCNKAPADQLPNDSRLQPGINQQQSVRGKS